MNERDWLQVNLRKMRVATSVAAWENFGTPPWIKNADDCFSLEAILEQVCAMLIYHHRQTGTEIDRPSMAEMARARLGLVAYPTSFTSEQVNGGEIEKFLNNNYIVAFDIKGVGFPLDTMTFSLSMAVPQRPVH